MKLIIDIPEDLKKMIFDNKMFDIAHSYRLAMCVKNGTPLDDVKAEVEKMPTEKIARCRKAYIFASEFKIKVLEILDNIGKADMRTNRKNCEYRHENGNCLKVGGFCTAVDDEHCMRNKIRCNTCKNNDDELSGECYECIKGIFDHYEPQESEDKE